MSPNHHQNCGCKEFGRVQAAQAAATAGQGLPAIEPGMPTPAGTGLSRRKFLSRSAGLALAVYGASKLPFQAFEEGIAYAAGPDKILVSIFLEGGIDSMSVLAPVGDSRYATLRPTLALPPNSSNSFSEDPTLQWNSAAAGLKTLHGEGKVSVLPAIGYTSPNQSHFTSRHYYEIGETSVGASTGWLGRYLDRIGDPDNPLQGLSLDGTLSPQLATATNPVAAIDSVDAYDLWAPVSGQVEDEMFTSFGRLGSFNSDSAEMTKARRATRQTEQLREELHAFSGFSSPVTYPDNGFAHSLAGVAALIAAGMPLHCVTLNAYGGYDTHSDEATDLPNNLQRTCDGILAFQRDLEARGMQDRVLIEMWSEFGRRPEENGSGTDHGAAGCGFVIGSKAQGEMVGSFPGLATLDADDNLLHTSDFRGMYCSLLEQWFGTDPAGIINGESGFSRYPLVQA